MRDAAETCHFPLRQAASLRPSRTDLAENIAAAGAIFSIASKLFLQRTAKFREEMGNGLHLRVNPKPRPLNPKQEKEIKS
jgi:hypothetical protein